MYTAVMNVDLLAYGPGDATELAYSRSSLDHQLKLKVAALKFHTTYSGPELTADAFVDWAEEHGVKLLFIQPGKPNQNAFIERFNRSFRQEVLDAWLFNAISEVQDAADAWLTDYNEYRPHDSLGNIPPALFRPRVFNQEVSNSELST